MGQLSKERLKQFKDESYKYFDWMTVLSDGGITEVQDLDDQLLLKCFLHPDKRPSLRVVLRDHYWHCFSCQRGGTVVDMMYELSSKTIPRAQFFEQLLKRTPAMQRELGFSSLFVDAFTLDAGFEGRRKFSPKNHIGSSVPISVLSKKVRAFGDSWENLVYSLTLLQEGETPETIISRMRKINEVATPKPEAVISLMSFLDD